MTKLASLFLSADSVDVWRHATSEPLDSAPARQPRARETARARLDPVLAADELECIARRELARLLVAAGLRLRVSTELATRSSVRLDVLDALALDWMGRSSGKVAARNADRELVRVHEHPPPRRLDTRWLNTRWLDARWLSTWTKRARRLLRTADECGWTWDGLDWLRRAERSASSRNALPRLDARAAAVASLLAADSLETRLWWVCQQLERGAAREALRACQALLSCADASWPAVLTLQAWRALADAHEACGNDRLALAACLEVLKRGDRSPWPAQHGLVLALAIGDTRRARMCARWLERCEHGAKPRRGEDAHKHAARSRNAARGAACATARDDSHADALERWHADLALLRARVQRLRGPLPWRPAFRWLQALAGARDGAEREPARRSKPSPSHGVETPIASASRMPRALARAQEVCQALT